MIDSSLTAASAANNWTERGGGAAAPWLLDDELWASIEPLLPPWPARAQGPRPVADRLCLQGILFVLSTGITWQQLPLELGFGSGQTCWRRLCRWSEAGVFGKIHQVLLSQPQIVRRIDWTRVAAAVSSPPRSRALGWPSARTEWNRPPGQSQPQPPTGAWGVRREPSGRSA